MNTKQTLKAAALVIIFSGPAIAEDTWFVRPYVGLSHMSDLSSDFSDIDGFSGDADIDLDTGFVGGIGVGYHYTDNFSIEVAWEYRTNDSETVLNDLSKFDNGNFASNTFYLNGHYLFSKNGQWQPYIGGGLSWVQEVDIDLERNGDELSYSGDGDVGYQVFVGMHYDIGKSWKLQSELRYGSVQDIELNSETGNSGKFGSIDYETTTLQFGLVYKF